MAFTKITDEERVGKGNVGQPDTPLLTTTQMQEQMDSLANLAIDGFNRHIDEISGEYGAQNIGMAHPANVTAANNVFAIINAMAVILKTVQDDKHTHLNKTLLDALTDEDIQTINDLASVFGNIEAVQTTISNSSTAVPTSSAVVSYVENHNYAQSILDTIYPIGAIYATTTVAPDTLFGSLNCWTLIETTSSGVKIYRRTA